MASLYVGFFVRKMSHFDEVNRSLYEVDRSFYEVDRSLYEVDRSLYEVDILFYNQRQLDYFFLFFTNDISINYLMFNICSFFSYFSLWGG